MTDMEVVLRALHLSDQLDAHILDHHNLPLCQEITSKVLDMCAIMEERLGRYNDD